MEEGVTSHARRIERSLPAEWYFDAAQYQRELERIWYRRWIYVGRADAIPEPLDYVTHRIGTQVVLVLRDERGAIRAFHNTCRHRGSALCRAPSGRLAGGRITCAYHGWSYNLRGELARLPLHDRPRPDGLDGLGLYPVAVTEWRGFVFVNLAGEKASTFESSAGDVLESLAHWPLAELQVGHTHSRTVQCNWKIFWENYNECLHCPAVHPALSALVPIYKRGIMEPGDDPDWTESCDSVDPGLSRRAACQRGQLDNERPGVRRVIRRTHGRGTPDRLPLPDPLAVDVHRRSRRLRTRRTAAARRHRRRPRCLRSGCFRPRP